MRIWIAAGLMGSGIGLLILPAFVPEFAMYNLMGIPVAIAGALMVGDLSE